MCGIIGYIGFRSPATVLLDGLRKLEYRGYDSAGLCIINDQGVNLIKQVGRVAELDKATQLTNLAGQLGIAHTRWATHGVPNQINAHPHLDCTGQIAIVHNGIIENYQALRELLTREGHKFVSQTDSEVVAHLVEKFYHGNLEAAVSEALKLVEGAFGLAIIKQGEHKIVVARRGSPLIIGLGEQEMFVASDVPAILNYTKQVIYLNDNEMAVMTANDYRVTSLDGEELDPDIHEVKWTVEEIAKKGFKHFMLKEIFEQPEAVANTLRGRVKDQQIKLSLVINPNEVKRLVITACGTSWHAALIGKYLLEKMLNLPVEVDYASEFRYRDPLVHKGDIMVVISQSGETADTLAALREAKNKGAQTIGIINVVGSTIAREVDSGIFLHAGPEIGVASTKAFSCQVTALLLLGMWLKQERGQKVSTGFINQLLTLPELIKQTLACSDLVQNIAKRYQDNRNFLYLGRGLNFPVALEGALKLKEISYIHAEGYPAAEMKHGPIALVDANMPVVFVAPHDKTYEKIVSNMQEIKARQGRIIAIVNEVDEAISQLADDMIVVPKIAEELSPIINAIPLQLFAYHIADLKGLDVDKPRNLAKSVTVE